MQKMNEFVPDTQMSELPSQEMSRSQSTSARKDNFQVN